MEPVLGFALLTFGALTMIALVLGLAVRIEAALERPAGDAHTSSEGTSSEGTPGR